MTPRDSVRHEDPILGYADRWSVRPGETVRFMVSVPFPTYKASIVRLIHADANPEGPGYRDEQIAWLNPLRPGRRQRIQPGSYVDFGDAEPLRNLSSFTLLVWIWSTTPQAGREQGIASKWSMESGGYALVIDDRGFLRFRIGRGSGAVDEIVSEEPLRRREWYVAAAGYDSNMGVQSLVQHSASNWANPQTSHVVGHVQPVAPPQNSTSFRLAAGGSRDNSLAPFNGKLDAPAVFGRTLEVAELEQLIAGRPVDEIDRQALVAAWNLGAEPHSQYVRDTSKNGLDGCVVNMPMRAVTGRSWSGTECDFRLAPAEYSAIHFHADDLEDAAWDADLAWQVPSEVRSGLYAARIEADDGVDHIPFVVRPDNTSTATDDRPHVAVLLPTMTYQAYANFPLGINSQRYRPPDWQQPPEPLDETIKSHPELGKSLYELHEDGSGHVYASHLRPILTTRPTYRASFIDGARHLAADLYLIDWLEAKAFPYHVITDHDLHSDGVELLRQYSVVITGSHPEYATSRMLDSLEGFVRSGGRLMYLGGNGFYWVTSVDPARPHVIEVRRGHAGSMPWESEPGETHHSTTGELGGLWRYRGRPPNRLVGVGFSAEGVGECGGYRRTSESHDKEVAFVFEGVDERVAFGHFGLVMDSAVGDELDRADPFLGTPAQARILASSVDVSPYYGTCREDDLRWRSERPVGEARSDLVYLSNSKGGAVFSVGSISWMASLSHNHYNNDVSRITENVLRGFASSAPVQDA